VVRKAESDIANLLHRYLSPEALRKAIASIRDRTALMTRDVRKNMHERSMAAMKILEKTIGVDFPSQRTRRHGRQMLADEVLRAAGPNSHVGPGQIPEGCSSTR
jgi:hypothetical protein